MATKKLTFEESMQQLEGIVEEISAGKLTLSEMINLYEKGMAISRHCAAELDAYESKIMRLSTSSGELTEES